MNDEIFSDGTTRTSHTNSPLRVLASVTLSSFSLAMNNLQQQQQLLLLTIMIALTGIVVVLSRKFVSTRYRAPIPYIVLVPRVYLPTLRNNYAAGKR